MVFSDAAHAVLWKAATSLTMHVVLMWKGKRKETTSVNS